MPVLRGRSHVVRRGLADRDLAESGTDRAEVAVLVGHDVDPFEADVMKQSAVTSVAIDLYLRDDERLAKIMAF